MLARELPDELRFGSVEGHFRCSWRVSRSGKTVSIVARKKSGKRLRPRMNAVGRVSHRWETTRPVMLSKPIVPPKARMITFYRNGDPFHSGTKVSIMPGKDFVSLDSLCDYLTQRMGIPHGARYIFSLTGRRVTSLEDLLDGYSYVVSGTKSFQELAYGQSGRVRAVSRAHLPLPIRKEDLKLYRPLSPQSRTPKSLRSRSLPAHNDGRTITVVNSQNPSISGRVLLNLRTTQSFEEVLQDLGQAIKVPRARRLYNQAGDEVRSFSQLKYELKKGETFYIDADDPPVSSGRKSYLSLNTVENEYKHRIESRNGMVRGSTTHEDEIVESLREFDNWSNENGNTTSVNEDFSFKGIDKEMELLPPEIIKEPLPPPPSKAPGLRHGKRARQASNKDQAPNYRLDLTWVHGYHGLDPGRNLFILTSGELAYYVGAIAILHHYSNGTQRHYLGHTEDILCMALHSQDDILATGQGSGIESRAQGQVHVWRASDLTTLAVVGEGRLESDLVGAAFAWKGSLMMLLEGLQDTYLSLWDWQHDTEVSRIATGQSVLGGAFQPSDEPILATYGRQHLAFWFQDENGHLLRQDPLSAGRSGTNFVSVEFLSDGRLVSGNSRGFITVWAPSEDASRIFFIQKEFKAHEGEVTALLFLSEGVLISGSSYNEDGEIHVWDIPNKFASLASAVLPTGSGGVMSLCPQKDVTNEWEIFVGTNKNVIFEGSVIWALNPVVHGHCDDVRALASHPDKPCFVTAGLDRYICKWEVSSLVWKVQSDSECFSITIHPHGSIVAVGDEHGDVTFLNMEDGLHVTTLPVADSPLYTLKYSPDGDTLAVGSADGNIYLFQTHSNGYMYKIDFVLPGSVPVLMLDWSADGQYVQAVFTDNDFHDIVFWDLKRRDKIHSASRLKELEWHKPNCTLGYKINGLWNNRNIPDAVHVSCHVSQYNHLLASGDKNGFIRLFRYPTTSEKAAYEEKKQCSTDVNAVQFLSDGQHLVTTGGPDGAIFVWKLTNIQSQ